MATPMLFTTMYYMKTVCYMTKLTDHIKSRRNEGGLSASFNKTFPSFLLSIQLGFQCTHSEQAVIAHACHGHTLQLSTGLSVLHRRLVTLLEVSERRECVVALHLPFGPLKTCSVLEPVPRCEPSTNSPLADDCHCAIMAGTNVLLLPSFVFVILQI